MLESLVSSLLVKYLGDYVEGLDKDNLNIGLTKGDVTLANLRLKRSALDGLELPVVIKEGFLGKLSLQIPWRDLGSKPVVVRIERVYLIVRPKPRTSDAQSLEDILKQEQLNKTRRLQLAEVLGLDAAPDEDDEAKKKRLAAAAAQGAKQEDSGFFGRLANKIVDNLQIFIDKIHIRYEDEESNPGKPFVFGITLDGLHAQSCDADWRATFLTVGDTIMRKLVDLRNLSIYWNTCVGAPNTRFVQYASIDDMAAALDALIYSGNSGDDAMNGPDHAYLLRPISGRLRARIDKSDQILMDQPKIQLDLDVDEVGLGLNSGQYRRMLDMLDSFTLYSRSLPYLKFRPAPGVTPSKNPRAWWNFALDCIKHDTRTKNEKWSWESIKARKEDRNNYMQVFKKKQLQGEKKLSQAERDQLAQLEQKLSYDDIILFRKLANAAVLRERAKEKELKEKQKAAGGGGITGWVSSWWSGSKPVSPATSEPASPSTPQLSKEEEQAQAMRELYSAIGFDENAASSSGSGSEPVYPREYVKTRFGFTMKRALVELTEEAGQRARIIVLNLNSFNVSTLLREGSMSVVGALDSITAIETATLKGKTLVALTSNSPGKEDDAKFMTLQFDLNPLDVPAEAPLDVRLGLKSRPVSVIFSRALIDRLGSFFSTEGSATGYEQISAAATTGFDSLKQRAQNSIKYSLEQKKKLKIDLDLQAPRIAIPQRFVSDFDGSSLLSEEPISTLVVDLGSLSFSSDPYAATRSGVVESEVKEDFFYDHYQIAIRGVNAGIIANSPDGARSETLGCGDIVRPFDLNFDLKLLTAPTPELPKVRLAAELPNLHVEVTRDKIVRLMDIMKAVGSSAATAPAGPAPVPSKPAPAVVAARDSKRQTQALQPPPTSNQVGVKAWTKTTVRALTTVMPKKTIETATAEPTVAVLQKIAAIDFSLQQLTISLALENPGSTHPDGSNSTERLRPLADIRLIGAAVKFENSNQDMVVGVKLRGLEIEDRMYASNSTDRRQRFLICSRNSSDDLSAASLVSITYIGIPKDSPIYKKVDHNIDLTFDCLDINVNRLSIALLLQVLTSLSASQEARSQPMVPTPAIGSAPQQELVQAAEEVLHQKKEHELEEAQIEHPPEFFDFSLATIKMTVKAVSLNLNKDGSTFLSAELADTTAHVDARGDTTLLVEGSVGALTVTEVGALAPEYANIVSIGGEKMLSFHYETFSKANSHAAIAYPGHDMSVRVVMGSIRGVFINRLVRELASYFGAFAQMREVTAAAASYYYSQSKQAVQAAAQSTTKLHLDVTIGNPYLLVPIVSSNGNEHLVLDLGRISIKNGFEYVGPTSSIVVDDMKINIDSFNIRTESNGKAMPIIDKTDLTLGLRRAIAKNEKHLIPDLEISLAISAIVIGLCDDQLSMIMSTLKGNLVEPILHKDEKEMKQIAEILGSASFNAETWRDAAQTQPAPAAGDVAPVGAAAEPFLTMRLQMTLAQVSLQLSEGSGVGTDGRHTLVATFAMNQMGLSFDMRSNGSMQLRFTMLEILMEDARIRTNNQFRRILAPAIREEGIKLEDQLTVAYDTIPENHRTDIKVALVYPRLYIIPDSLAYIYKFVMALSDKAVKDLAEYNRLNQLLNSNAQTEEEKAKESETNIKVAESDEPAAQEAAVSTMVVSVVLKSPEIAVVEDSFAPSSTALILHLGDSTVRYIQTSDGQMKIDLHLDKFDVYKCLLIASTQGSKDVTLLLQPFSIGFNMSSSPIDLDESQKPAPGQPIPKASRMAAEIGLIKTIVSYRDLRLTLTIWKSFQPLLAAFQPPAKKDDESPAPTPESSKIEELPDEESEMESESSREAPSPASPASSDSQVAVASPAELDTSLAEPQGEPISNIIVTLKGISFSLLDDRIDPAYSKPVLKFWIDAIQATVRSWATQEMIVTTGLDTLEMSAYNNELASHEPIIEPWRLVLEYRARPGFMSVHLEADEMLDINITRSFLDATLTGMDIFRELTSEKSTGSSAATPASGSTSSGTLRSQRKEADKRQSFNPYVIRNNLSRPVRYWISGRSEVEFGHLLQPGQEQPLQIRESRDNVAEQPVRCEIDIRILSSGQGKDDSEQFKVIRQLPISKVQKLVMSPHLDQPDLKFVASVEYQSGSKIVTLRSDHTIENDTDFTLEVVVETQNGDWPLANLEPGAKSAIPLDCSNFSAIKLRPTADSKRKFAMSRVARELRTGLVSCSTDEQNARDAPVWTCSFRSKTVETPDGHRDTTLSFRPALIFENLLPTSMSFKLFDQDDHELFQKQYTPKASTTEFYEAARPSKLNKLQISVSVPEFNWSKPVEFALKPVEEPFRIVCSDNKGRPLKLYADVKRDELGSIVVSIHVPYLIINQTGLRLMYKKAPGEKEIAAGQVIDETALHALPNGQESWYWEDEHSNQAVAFAHSTDYNYAKNRFLYGEKNLSLKVEDSAWSKDFPLGVQNQGVIYIEDEKISGRTYQFAVSVSPAPGSLWRTKVVRIFPHVVIVNKTNRTLSWKQQIMSEKVDEAKQIASAPQQVTSNRRVPLHWPIGKSKKSIAISLDSEADISQRRWSGYFAIDSVNSFQAKLRRSGSLDAELVQISVRVANGSTFVIVNDGSLNKEINLCASYRIENKSSSAVTVCQKDLGDISVPHRIDSKATSTFCWDDPHAKEPAVLLALADEPKTTTSIDMDAITDDISPLVSKTASLRFEVKADGATKVLVISDYDPAVHKRKKRKQKKDNKKKAKGKGKEKEDATEGTNDPSNDGEEVRVVSMEINVSMKGIGVSVIDQRPQELLYLTLQTVSFKMTQSNVDSGMELIIGQGQIDNQLYLTPLPILLYAHPNESGAPFMHLSMVRNTRYQNIQMYHYFAFALQEIDISVDQPFLFRLLSYVNFVNQHLLSRNTAEAEGALLNNGGAPGADPMPSVSEDQLKVSDMFYFELFHLNPIRANITFLPMPNPDRIEGDDNEEDDETAIERVLGYVGALASIERAPLELNSLLLEHPFTTSTDLVSRITQHYTMAALRQAYLLVGSADFLGNPVSLVSNLGTGVKDFFYEPAQGIVKSPKDFGKGLAKGTASLIKKSTYALFDTASKLTGTVAKVGATLTMDDDYKRDRAARSAVQAKHAGEGLLYGFRDFGIGLYKGVTGVVLEPIKGAKKEGALGLLKGVGRGMAGVVLKPVVGAVDIVTRTTEGIKNTTRYFDEKRKAPIRPPRYIPGDKLITVYNFDKSFGQQILRTVDKARLRKEEYIFHMVLKDKSGKDDDIVIGTKLRIMLITSQIIQTSAGFKVDWHEPLKNIVDVEVRENTILLWKKPKPGEEKKEKHARKITCNNPEDLKELHKKLMSAGTGLRSKLSQENRDKARERFNPRAAASGSSSTVDSRGDDVVVSMPIDRQGPGRTSSAFSDLESDDDAFQGAGEREDDPLLAQRKRSEKQRANKMKGGAAAPKKPRGKGERTPLLADQPEGDEEEDGGCCSCCCVC